MAIIDPSDLEELDDEFIASVMQDEPQELSVDHSGREEEPERQWYDDYEVPPTQLTEGDE
ncbi:MAG: hypothetical protein ACM3WP_02130 [Acidobacteriota bacterium]